MIVSTIAPASGWPKSSETGQEQRREEQAADRGAAPGRRHVAAVGPAGASCRPPRGRARLRHRLLAVAGAVRAAALDRSRSGCRGACGGVRLALPGIGRDCQLGARGLPPEPRLDRPRPGSKSRIGTCSGQSASAASGTSPTSSAPRPAAPASPRAARSRRRPRRASSPPGRGRWSRSARVRGRARSRSRGRRRARRRTRAAPAAIARPASRSSARELDVEGGERRPRGDEDARRRSGAARPGRSRARARRRPSGGRAPREPPRRKWARSTPLRRRRELAVEEDGQPERAEPLGDRHRGSTATAGSRDRLGARRPGRRRSRRSAGGRRRARGDVDPLDREPASRPRARRAAARPRRRG